MHVHAPPECTVHYPGPSLFFLADSTRRWWKELVSVCVSVSLVHYLGHRVLPAGVHLLTVFIAHIAPFGLHKYV